MQNSKEIIQKKKLMIAKKLIEVEKFILDLDMDNSKKFVSYPINLMKNVNLFTSAVLTVDMINTNIQTKINNHPYNIFTGKNVNTMLMLDDNQFTKASMNAAEILTKMILVIKRATGRSISQIAFDFSDLVIIYDEKCEKFINMVLDTIDIQISNFQKNFMFDADNPDVEEYLRLDKVDKPLVAPFEMVEFMKGLEERKKTFYLSFLTNPAYKDEHNTILNMEALYNLVVPLYKCKIIRIEYKLYVLGMAYNIKSQNKITNSYRLIDFEVMSSFIIDELMKIPTTEIEYHYKKYMMELIESLMNSNILSSNVKFSPFIMNMRVRDDMRLKPIKGELVITQVRNSGVLPSI